MIGALEWADLHWVVTWSFACSLTKALRRTETLAERYLFMRSIKPGRAPSWGGVFGGIIGAIFGVFWTVGATSMGAPGFFTAFGVMFVCVAIFNIFYSLHNATSRRRFSTFDITEEG